MYSNNYKELVNDIKMTNELANEIEENVDSIKKVDNELGISEEDKKTVTDLENTLSEIKEQSQNLITDEDKKTLEEKNKLSYYIQELLSYEEKNPSQKEIVEKRINDIKDSYLLTPFFNFTACYDRRNIKSEVNKMKKEVFEKLDKSSFMFPQPIIASKLENILPNNLKKKTKKLVAHIYSYILSNKSDDKMIFIYFFLKNLKNYEKAPNSSIEKQEFTKNIIELAKIV